MQDLGIALFLLATVGSLTAWGLAIPRIARHQGVFDFAPGPRRPVSAFAFVSVCWLLVSLFVFPMFFSETEPVDLEPDVTAPGDAEPSDVAATDVETATEGAESDELDAALEPVESQLAGLVNILLIEIVIYAFLVLIWWISLEPLPQPLPPDSELEATPPPVVPRFRPAKEIEQGALAFLLSLPLVLLANIAIRALTQDDTLHPLLETIEQDQSPLLVLLVAANAIVMAPLLEELQFRVILQGWLADRLPIGVALCVPALLFCSVHRFPDAFALVPLALMLGWLYHHRGSYLGVVTAHALFNVFNLVLMLCGL